jgi:Fe-S cluster assembly protein SufD
MTAATTPRGDAVARYRAEYEAFAANGASGEPDWLRARRDAAISHFAEAGFPTPKDERWRFTNVDPIVRTRFAPAPAVAPAAARDAANEVAIGDPAHRLVAVYVNGRFAPELSSLNGLPSGVTIGGLAEAVATRGDLVSRYLARYASVEANPFAALATAFLAHGAFVFVPKNAVVDLPIQLIYVAAGGAGPTRTHLRSLIVAEAGAQISVLEQYVGVGGGPSWTNVVSEVVLGENAVVDAYRVQREADDAFHTATTQSYQARSSVLTSTAFVFGAALSRHDILATLDGEGAECTLNGLSVLRGDQHADHHTTLEHAKPHCPSWELFNGIYDDRSRGVFTGRIIVRPGAQRTDSKQTNNNLLLSASARADSQPQLEIYADDVKCTHGATLGPIDPRAMFYLQSRGVPQEAARNLLTYGFGAEILNSVSIEELRAQLDTLLHQRLDDGARRRSRAAR